VPLIILDVQAPEALLRERIGLREREGADASEAGQAVLERQLTAREPLAPDEEAAAVRVQTDARIDPDAILAAVGRLTADRAGLKPGTAAPHRTSP
jgi:predicted kinase